MSNKEDTIKHLEMIQGIITRLAHNSFLFKGWSITILAALLIFAGRNEIQFNCLVLVAFLIPIFSFWSLDAYYLWQERRFRKLYDKVRKKTMTDFSMQLEDSTDKPRYCCALCSKQIIWLYIAEAGGLSLYFIFN